MQCWSAVHPGTWTEHHEVQLVMAQVEELEFSPSLPSDIYQSYPVLLSCNRHLVQHGRAHECPRRIQPRDLGRCENLFRAALFGTSPLKTEHPHHDHLLNSLTCPMIRSGVSWCLPLHWMEPRGGSPMGERAAFAEALLWVEV